MWFRVLLFALCLAAAALRLAWLDASVLSRDEGSSWRVSRYEPLEVVRHCAANVHAPLSFLLLKNRPFVGGNETTALMALLRFLALNQAALKDDVSDADLIWLAQSVNRSDLDREAMERWLRENLAAEHQ